MPKFIAKPVGVEAFQFDGHTHMLPEDFRMAVRRHLPGGTVEVMTGDGLRPCKHGDWIMRGPSGDFSVVRNATFETMYTDYVPEAVKPGRVTRKDLATVG